MSTEPIIVVRADVAKIIKALIDGKQIAGMRVIGAPRVSTWVNSFTVKGEGWTLYASTTHGLAGEFESSLDYQLFGDRTRFEEDYIMAKMMIC